MSTPPPLPIRFGRETCGELDRAETLEWLVTNGIGGYASGTVAGLRTRRYHGLLVAALAPPTQRTVMVAEAHEAVRPSGAAPIALHCSRWADGSVSPRGFEHIESFHLDGRTPVWRFAIGEFCLEKRLVMVPGKNTTVLSYRLVRGSHPLSLEVKLLATHRDYHGTTCGGGWRMRVEGGAAEVRVTPFEGAETLRLAGEGWALEPAHAWYEGFALRAERDRGLDSVEDALHVATATIQLAPDQTVALFLTTEGGALELEPALHAAAAAEALVLERYGRQQGALADDVGARLALAADQFMVRRDLEGVPGSTVIAGYHWFTDWGRDSMIALPGLTLPTGRPELARQILRTFAHFTDHGMLPNRFPDTAGPPEYNTVDATLWFVEAVRAYVSASGDEGLAGEMWPALTEIIQHHVEGTRFGIGVDAGDGLLRSGEPGVQLTWMDAKVGDWVVTPRTGKCVEINALWYNALVSMAGLAAMLGRPPGPWELQAARAKASFQRFWEAERGYLADVIDGPDGEDDSLRPNQLFAVSLPASPLAADQQRSVVEACERALMTSHGLRSLAADHPAYRASYGGDQVARDGAYHQGTVWAWLAGPFAMAHHRVFGDARLARAYLEPLVDHLRAHGLGTIAEIFDGAPPHRAAGCIAQAWSVAETLRAWTELRRLEHES